MSEKKQHKNIIITAACTTLVVAVVAVIGAMSIKQEPETIQGPRVEQGAGTYPRNTCEGGRLR